ncbi:hypothetical protein P3W45_001651 [Vairimorpha bombi]
MNKEDDYISRIKSKNWKERQECYLDLRTEFEAGRYLDLIGLLQNETNIPALESAIDAILKASIIPDISCVKKIFTHIGNSKTSVKTRIYKLIHFCNVNDDLIDCLCELLTNKSPKVVSSTVNVLSEIDTKHIQVLKSLNLIFNHPDKNVRFEGTKLAVELYKKIGNEIKKYLDIKPIQMKELEEEFSKYGDTEVKQASVQEIPFDKINDSKWNIRLEGLEVLKDALITNTDVPNISNILFSKINDPNNQVFFLVLDIINIIKCKTSRIINGLIERLKDKKVAITDRIKDTLVNIEIDTVSTNYFSSKSPELKYNLIDVCVRSSIKDEEVIKCIGKCTEDSNGQVRNKAVEALREMNFDNNILPSSVLKKINRKTEDIKKAADIKKVKDEKKMEDKKESRKVKKKSEVYDDKLGSSFIKDDTSFSKNILESFILKYPFLKDQSWTVRRDGILSHTKHLLSENINELCTFILTSKDPNFIVNNALIDILINRKDELNQVEGLVVLYCVEKITENKMRSKLLELVGCIGRDYAVNRFVGEACKIKKGKKFIEIVRLIKDIQNKEEEIENIFKIPITGIQEKKIVEELRNIYYSTSVEESEVEIQEENNEKDNINNEKGNINNEKDTKEEVLSLMKDGDVYQVINLLDKIDRISLSDKIIEFYIMKDVQSTFFNTLLVYFITNKHILTEEECTSLVNHFLIKGMTEEMNMVDRVYPVTKLFYVLQKINTDESVEYIIKLIEKYKMFSGDKKKLVRDMKKAGLKNIMRESVDFLSFIDGIGDIKGDIKEDVKGDVKGDIKEDVKGDVKGDIKEDVKGDVKGDSKDFSRDDLKNFSRDDLKNFSGDFSKGNVIHSAQEKNSKAEKKDIEAEKKAEKISFIYETEENKIQKPFKNKSSSPIPNKSSSPIPNKFPSPIQDKLLAPSIYEDSFNIDIETSLDCLNLSGTRLTPNVKKFRKEFFSPMKNINNLEDILDNIIDNDQEKSEDAFRKLSEIIRTNISSVLFSANSIISSISIQLLDVLHRPLYAKLILNVLLKLSQSRIFCEQIRKETLESVNLDLINILKGTDQILSDLVSDILTNLCLNSKMSIILEVYLNLLNDIKGSDIPLKLLWRHSKSLDMRNKEGIQKCITVLEDFYKKSVYSDLLENSTSFKISILHLREISVYYQERIFKFNMGKYVRRIVERIQDDKEININVLRK